MKGGEKREVGEEMGEVVWVLVCVGKERGVEVREGLRKKVEKKRSGEKERDKKKGKV